MTPSPVSQYFILNGRKISFEEVLKEQASPTSEFEKDTLSFMKSWLNKDDIYYFKSSGSTGTPKPIPVKRGQIMASIKATASALNLKSGDNALLCIPVANTGGKMMIARALELGLSLECKEPGGNPLLNLNQQPDFLAVVPLQLHKILSDTKTKTTLDNTINTIVGGAPADDSLVQDLQQVKSKVFATYGMTETVSHIALKLLNTPAKQEHFQALPNIEIDTDERGCIKIKGAVTDNQWTQTNDRIRILEGNKFDWLGRHDLVINSGGYKIQPEQLERSLEHLFRNHNVERQFFVHGLPHKQLGSECTLFIEGELIAPVTMDKLTKEMKNTLHSYEVPRKIVFVKHFKTTKSGKLDRKSTAVY